jgi:hypothetical protein
VAELVQNSLDAGAHHVSVERRRIRRVLCLVVRDDGEGVLPGQPREDALRYIATHVGHSHKLGIDPAERQRRVMAGKYGVGLLGFWCVGRQLELRSRVDGSEFLALRLEEDRPNADILRLPIRADLPATLTEAVVVDVHATAQRTLSGRRLADFLAAELRGQLLAREVELRVHDRIARGLAQKEFLVVPRRFVGERLELPEQVEVPGFSPLRVELHLDEGSERPAIQVACAGTLVAEDIGQLGGLELAEPPWVGRSLTGLLDFADFSVPPGTRRGVVPDAAADAFVRALAGLRPLVEARLAELERARQQAIDRRVVRDLRRALRGLRRRLPQYDVPHVEDGGSESGDGLGAGESLPGAVGAPAGGVEPPELFPPGPLAAVAIVPEVVEVAPGGERRVRARASDAEGRRVKDVTLDWRIVDAEGLGLDLHGTGLGPALRAPPGAPLGGSAELRLVARQNARLARAKATVRIAEDEERGALGIPEPRLVSDPGGSWRSRMSGNAWEVNDGHEDYRALRADARARLRYLLALLSKEIVLRTAGRPDVADVLESLVEILAHAERNLSSVEGRSRR